MTRQELFDKAFKGVIAQGGRSMGQHGCSYRGMDGRKCAIGHLITDGLAYIGDNLEGHGCSVGVRRLIDEGRHREVPDWLNAENKEFLSRLQRAHDMADGSGKSFEDRYKLAMRAVAEKFHLNTDVIDAH